MKFFKYLTDSLTSLVSGMGMESYDKLASVAYKSNALSKGVLQAGYEGTWLIQNIVDVPAEDALQEWRDWKADEEQIKKIRELEDKLQLQAKLTWGYKLARLFGGSIIYIGTEGEKDVTQELGDKEVITHLQCFSPDEVITGDLNDDPLSEDYAKPMWYELSAGTQARIEVHPSRFIRISSGFPEINPWQTNIATREKGWDRSIIQSVYNAVTQADSVCANIAALVFEANIDVIGVPDLMANLADEDYVSNVLERFRLANLNKSVNRSLIHDSDETYDRKQISFATLPELAQQFLMTVSAAARMPVTKLLQTAPKGLNATGEGDMENYNKQIKNALKLNIGPALYKFDELLINQALGSRPPEIEYDWHPLEEMNALEISQIGNTYADIATKMVDIGAFDSREMREVLLAQFGELKIFPGIDQIVSASEPDPNFLPIDPNQQANAENRPAV